MIKGVLSDQSASVDINTQIPKLAENRISEGRKKYYQYRHSSLLN